MSEQTRQFWHFLPDHGMTRFDPRVLVVPGQTLRIEGEPVLLAASEVPDEAERLRVEEAAATDHLVGAWDLERARDAEGNEAAESPMTDIEMHAIEAAYDVLEVRGWDDDDLRNQIARIIQDAIRGAARSIGR